MRLSGRKPSSFTRPWTQRQRLVLHSLIGINLVMFVAQLFLDAYQPGFVREYLGLSKAGIDNAYAWQFLTAPFLHAGPWHLLANTFVLYVLGRDVECVVGQRDFLFLYLMGAAVGELGHVFLFPAASVVYGASAGTAAVLMAYATILPELEFATPRLFGRRWELKAKHLSYLAIVTALVLLFAQRQGTLTHSVYLGGCAAGWLYAHLLGFGRATIVQRQFQQRKATADRFERMDATTFMTEEVDPLLEKISREGLQSLSRQERRTLDLAREKLGGQS